MKIIKQRDEYLNICFEENDKKLEILFGGNGDLYWIIRSKVEANNHSFIITKENYEVYELFNKLFFDIENINIFDKDYTNADKDYYRETNHHNYNELYSKDSNEITWYSDETNYEVANILKIKKVTDSFVINFYTQENKNEYDKDFNSPHHIVIRFRNSGSRYKPFNVIFMRMYNDMNNITDINDEGHQMHIEEYLYNNNYNRKLKNNIFSR